MVDFEKFFPRLWIQSEILTELRIGQWQRIAESSIFWTLILDFACLKTILPVFRIQREIFYWRICLINHNGSVHLHTPIHPSQTAFTNCLQLIGSQQEHCLKKLMLGSNSSYPSLGGVHFIADSFEIVAVIEVWRFWTKWMFLKHTFVLLRFLW